MRAFLKGLLSALWRWLKRGRASGPSDPEAREHAWTLSNVFRAARESENPALFKETVERDSLKSRRAFISTLEYAKEQEHSSPKDSEAAVIFAAYLAYQIGESFDDPVPNQIIQGIEQKVPEEELVREVEVYARTLYPEAGVEST